MALNFKNLSRGTWIAVGGFVTVTTAFLALGFAPYWVATRRLEGDIAEYRQRMEQSARQSELLRDLSNRAGHMVRQVRDYPRLVPASKDLGLFLGQLSQELDSSGMRDTAVRALPLTPLGKCSQLPIEVHGSGSFEQFQDFLQRLEHLERMSSVSRLEVKADDAMSGKVTVDLTLSIYCRNEN